MIKIGSESKMKSTNWEGKNVKFQIFKMTVESSYQQWMPRTKSSKVESAILAKGVSNGEVFTKEKRQ